MANTLLTPTAITREALVILHQKLNFVGTINRQYDSSFAVSGAKIGDTLRVRLPNRYTVTDGRVMEVQDTAEEVVSLTVTTRKHVAMDFTADELALSMQDFSERTIEPAMAVLAAKVEADHMSMYKSVQTQVNNLSGDMDFDEVVTAQQKLNEQLAPNGKRYLNMNNKDAAKFKIATKGLFHDSERISQQYREGIIGRTSGFDIYENSLWTRHTSGSDDGTGDYLTNGASQTGATLTIDTGSGTLLKGDIITIADVNDVHPETKSDRGVLKQFTVTADTGASATSVGISPSIVASGAKQNVSAAAGDGKAITKVGGASATHGVSMAYHRDAFLCATADLVLPRGVHFAAREVYDGLSLRLVSDYDIKNDLILSRIDILYGYVAARPELAVRIANQ